MTLPIKQNQTAEDLFFAIKSAVEREKHWEAVSYFDENKSRVIEIIEQAEAEEEPSTDLSPFIYSIF